jgi:hypothetical protein
LTNRIFRIAIQAESAVIILINQQASAFGTDRLGPVLRLAAQEVNRPDRGDAPPTFHDRASHEAVWQAVVKVSGVDFPSAATSERCPEGEPEIGLNIGSVGVKSP